MAKRKKKTSARAIAEIKKKIESQRRRAARPTSPVNTQVRISESLAERRRREEKRRVQKGDWENL